MEAADERQHQRKVRGAIGKGAEAGGDDVGVEKMESRDPYAKGKQGNKEGTKKQ